MIQSLNKVELVGCVGLVKLTDLSNPAMLHARIMLATNYAYRNENNEPVIETTWHQCIKITSKENEKDLLRSLEKGDFVRLTGRIRNEKYTNSDGVEIPTTNIWVYDIEKINKEQ